MEEWMTFKSQMRDDDGGGESGEGGLHAWERNGCRRLWKMAAAAVVVSNNRGGRNGEGSECIHAYWELKVVETEKFDSLVLRMSSLRNAIHRRAHKERAQPQARKKFGLLEKHKDYVLRAKAFQKKEEAIQKLREKAAFRNPDEFYFKMMKTRTIDGVHRPESQARQYSQEELMLMKTQDIGYILQKLQSEKNKIAKLNSALHALDGQLPSKHVYYAEDREEAREIRSQCSKRGKPSPAEDVPDHIKRSVRFCWCSKLHSSYKELEARKNRVQELEKLHGEMSLQKELKKKGRKRKLREDELVNPTSGPVYKWRAERKR
ncbi:hypothetical protein Scep_011814 [Stephania cephalantha]|uniref:U3 small nucleolar RNA-associated protein 11 n=1 Tax=Stephania cephalantha TaxID=152367 RepID=A0AAP0JFH1_9MAGN